MLVTEFGYIVPNLLTSVIILIKYIFPLHVYHNFWELLLGLN